MATAYNYLVIVFCTTAGQRGALLGTDETDLILLVWVVVDLETNKVSVSAVRGIPIVQHKYRVTHPLRCVFMLISSPDHRVDEVTQVDCFYRSFL